MMVNFDWEEQTKGRNCLNIFSQFHIPILNIVYGLMQRDFVWFSYEQIDLDQMIKYSYIIC
jgi:hypothetical protein